MAIRTFGDRADTLNDFNSSNRWFMGGGNDIVDMRGGNDRVYGRDGNDLLRGGDGNDRVFGDRGFDVVRGGDGNDWVGGGSENDDVRGDLGADVVDGNIGNDRLALGFDAESAFDPDLGLGVQEYAVGDGFADIARFVVDTATESGRDTLYDFSPEQRDLVGSDGELYDVGDGDLIYLGAFGGFGDLDSNADGVLDNDDDFVGARSTGITLDVGGAFGVDDGGLQTLTVVGFNELLETDFLTVA